MGAIQFCANPPPVVFREATMGPRRFNPIATCLPSSTNGAYIYSILPASNNGLVVISSSDELVLLDRTSLGQIFSLGRPNVPTGVTCLQVGDQNGNVVLCAGRDGSVAIFDVRSQVRVSDIKLGTSSLDRNFCQGLIGYPRCQSCLGATVTTSRLDFLSSYLFYQRPWLILH